MNGINQNIKKMTQQNKQVTDYIKKAPSPQNQILEKLRGLIHSNVSEVSEEFKWGQPVFRADKNFCYLKSEKHYAKLGFFNFKNLDDLEGLLEGSGKQMRHVKIASEQDIDEELLAKWIQKAAKGTSTN